MGFVNFNIPVLVQNKQLNEQATFVLRPLFLKQPIVNARRFEQATTIFKKEIRRSLNHFIVTPETLDDLLWFLFNPDLDYQFLDLTIPYGKTQVTGKFAVAVFELKGIYFACLPAFSNYIFMVEQGKKGKLLLVQTVTNVIEKMLKNLRQQYGSELNPEDFCSDDREFVTNVQVSLHVRSGKFAFEEKKSPNLFQSLGQTADFDGAVEIEKVGENLNNFYPEDLKRSFFRETLVQRISKIIYQKENTPVVLLGREGVGKQTVIHEVVFQYLKEKEKQKQQKESLYAKIWQIDPTRVIAGMSIVGWWEKRLESIIKFVGQKSKGEPDKLLFTNAVALIRIGKSGSNDLAMSEVLRPYLEKRTLQVVLVATPEEWKVVQEKNRRFSDLFQVIRMQEPDLETAAKMVLKQRRQLEIEQGCTFTAQAIQQVFNFQRNYLKRKALPGSVMKIMNQLAAKYRYQIVDAPEVMQEFQSFSGLNNEIFDTEKSFETDEVKNSIASRLVGQDAAVQSLADTIHILKTKLNNPDKPVSSFLFIGPTGVGKTQAAKEICNYVMGSSDALIRFDMNEYIDAGAPSRLIGDYYNPEGQLTGKVRFRPFGVLLLDEIEKAHPKVHDLLLQVLDDGRLSDSLGRTVDFSNMIIIMTSNIGASEVNTQLGFDTKSRDDRAIYRKAVERFFRPEFVNRIDKTVIFNPLEKAHIHNIAKLQIQDLLRRDGFVRRTTILNITTDALEWVANRGYNAKMGGRALKRQIEKDLTALSAEQLISTTSNQPIILEIHLEKNQLIPNIYPLHFIERIKEDWFPELPSETKGKGFYNQLIRRIERIERKMNRLEKTQFDAQGVIITDSSSANNVNWQYYDFKDRVADLKERLQTLSLGFRDRYFREAPAIPLRLKSSNYTGRTSTYERNVHKDKMFQLEGLNEINESYLYSEAQFDSMQTEFIAHFIDVTFLEVAAKSFFKNQDERIKIEFKSFIEGRGDQSIKYLISVYSNLCEALDLSVEHQKNQTWIEVDGFGAYELLKAEAGIHLFYPSYTTPIPIGVTINRTNRNSRRQKNYQVIRLYSQSRFITDLRTGFTNDFKITPNEMKLLLYAGMKGG